MGPVCPFGCPGTGLWAEVPIPERFQFKARRCASSSASLTTHSFNGSWTPAGSGALPVSTPRLLRLAPSRESVAGQLLPNECLGSLHRSRPDQFVGGNRRLQRSRWSTPSRRPFGVNQVPRNRLLRKALFSALLTDSCSEPKSLDLTLKSYQNLNVLANKLTGFVDQLARYQGGQIPGRVLKAGETGRRVLEVVLPKLRDLTQAQIELLRRIQQEAARRGVEVYYYVTQ